ncbi:MAG: RNA-binding protein [Candidatus Diapherotrites archaeon CG09_land_8_20_14_0_10_32_12]|nr:MAG: RNA-binding protein [Candidatus Diapherotrites archaeon CG09_land_8_20_14_0_10_32_12]
MAICNTCNKKTDDYVKFKCPSCGEQIYRCNHCRTLGNTFKCKKCGMELP